MTKGDNGEPVLEEHYQFAFTEHGTDNQILFQFTGEVKDFIIQRLTGVVLP